MAEANLSNFRNWKNHNKSVTELFCFEAFYKDDVKGYKVWNISHIANSYLIDVRDGALANTKFYGLSNQWKKLKYLMSTCLHGCRHGKTIES